MTALEAARVGEGRVTLSTAVVVVVHNTRDDLLACLASLPAAGADEVVVVDSGSVDGSLEAAQAAAPWVRALRLANVGFGQAANAGVAATRAEVVVLANADTRFRPGSVAALRDYVGAHADVGVVGPLVRFPDGRLQLSARAFPSIPQALGHALLGFVHPDNRWTRAYRLTDWDHTSERDVDWVSGCCLAARRSAFDAVGGFDPAYFMFVEDVDLCWRMSRAGWRVAFTPSSEVLHDVGGAVSGRRLRMIVEHARSLDRFFARRYRGRAGRALRPLVRLGLAGWVLLAIAWTTVRGLTHAHA